MIYLIEGVPGSGKTYWVISFLLENYKNYDEVFANIDNLQLYCEDSEAFFKEFWYKDFSRFLDGKRRLLILDEFQRIANNEFFKKDNDFYYFFEIHRHYNFDIICVVQTKLALNNRLRNLVDVYIQAQSSRFSIFNRFYYLEKDPASDVAIRRFFLKKKKEVFDLYRSTYANKIVNAGSVLFSKWRFGLLLFFIPLFFSVFVLRLFWVKPMQSQSNNFKASKGGYRYVFTYNSSSSVPSGMSSGSSVAIPPGVSSVPSGVPGSVSPIPSGVPGSVSPIPSGVPGSVSSDVAKLVGYAEVYLSNSSTKKYLIFQNEKYYFVYSSKRSSDNSSGYISNLNDGSLSVGLNSGYVAREGAIEEVKNAPISNPRYR
jgi:hypothetical protein